MPFEAQQQANRVEIIGGLIDANDSAISDLIGDFIHDLTEAGAFRIHRDWSASEERKLVMAAATKAAVQAVLNSPWCDLPLEVEALYRERAQ